MLITNIYNVRAHVSRTGTADCPTRSICTEESIQKGKTGKTFALTDYCAIFAPRTKNSANN